MSAETWGHWCREQQPTTLPTSTPRCPQCGALNLSAVQRLDALNAAEKDQPRAMGGRIKEDGK